MKRKHEISTLNQAVWRVLEGEKEIDVCEDFDISYLYLRNLVNQLRRRAEAEDITPKEYFYNSKTAKAWI